MNFIKQTKVRILAIIFNILNIFSKYFSMKIKNFLIINIFLILFSIINFCLADTTSCYILIEGKAGCSDLNDITDVTHAGQLKCFTINKEAKDCGVFVNVLPNDTSRGLGSQLDKIDCTGEDRNTQECAEYCFGNDDASTSECVDCDSLTETEKAEYSYCQDEEDAKWCDAVSDDGVGSSWEKVLGGVEDVVGTC
ncbi:MAG TPA: hypothetical protein VLL98_03565, partial [Rickettsiales bacterium]|nr:hypothetical protein [Rickettsiales bacterium]